MSDELTHIWSRVQSELAGAVDDATYRIWLEPLRPRELTEGRLLVEVSEQAEGWIADRFARVLGACAARVLGADVEVELVLPAARSEHGERRTRPLGVGVDERVHDPLPEPMDPNHSPLGNPKLTFEQFVIGDCNRLAHAAALAVAEMPAQAYNPLFIYGPPGTGKTHLLGSISSLLLEHNPGLTIRYTTGESFTNGFLHALSTRHTDRFKEHFRQVDVLLVDDVQFLERKTRTEEEFFHTFNSLYDGGRQIVLSSDRPPRDLEALEERLRERFESGLVADIQPPDLATRMTILRKRANHDRLELDDEAPLQLIAERVTDNVRALEGALIRVVAFASLTGRRLTRELAQELLNGLYPPAVAGSSAPTVAQIAALACTQFGLTQEELLSATRATRVAWPRQVAMFLARELTEDSLPEIGRQFGGRDHTTVMHACRRTAQRIASDRSCMEAVDSLRRQLLSSAPAASNAPPDRGA